MNRTMFKDSLKKKSPKCLIVGIDGVPYSLLENYIEKGHLPNIKRILDHGYKLKQMDASIPDVSSVSWTTFMTGVNPGEHGIYGFLDLKPASYSIYFPNSRDIHVPTFWEILGKTSNGKDSSILEKYEGKLNRPYKSIIINIPQTYPASPINGILVAGFVAIDLKKATYPESAYRYLHSIDYEIDVDAQKAKDQKDIFMDELDSVFVKRKEAITHFLNKEEWDLFIATVTETDRLHHFFFDASNDENHPYHKAFISFYAEMDKFIGEIFDKFMDKTEGKGLFMMMSDHGFTVLNKEVYLNNWLKETGFLKVNEGREFFEKIDYDTKAFAMDPARFYINSEDKYPRGTVKALDKASIIKDIKDALRSLKDSNGNNVIREIYDAKDIYHGPLLSKSPDLVCLPNDGFDLKSSLQKYQTFGKEHFTGMHTQYDALCILPEGVQLESRLHIQNLSGVVIDWFCG